MARDVNRSSIVRYNSWWQMIQCFERKLHIFGSDCCVIARTCWLVRGLRYIICKTMHAWFGIKCKISGNVRLDRCWEFSANRTRRQGYKKIVGNECVRQPSHCVGMIIVFIRILWSTDSFKLWPIGLIDHLLSVQEVLKNIISSSLSISMFERTKRSLFSPGSQDS